MARRRKWKTCFLLLVMFILDSVIGTWSYEDIRSSYGSRSNPPELDHQSHKSWRQRERRGRSNQRATAAHNNQRRDRRNQAAEWNNRDRDKVIPFSRPKKYFPSPSKTADPYSSQHPLLEPCCPTILEFVEPLGGTNRTGEHVTLYRDKDVVQRFYEVSCHPDYVNQPCKFIASSKLSLCTQQYSYTYALIDRNRGHRGLGKSWTLDYIKVRSGCACEVTPQKRRKRPRESQFRYQ